MASPNNPSPDEQDPDDKYNPGEVAYQEGIGSGKPKNEKQGADGTPIDDSGSVRDDEEGGGWKNRVSPYAGTSSRSGKGISRGNFRAVLKKRGPVAAIITLLLGGGVGASVFFGPSLLLVQIQESFLTHFDMQNTSLTIRTNKIIVNKLSEDTTQGSCSVVKIACRFSRPSNKLLKNLERNGVLALDKNGSIISRKDGLFQPDRPTKYTFKGEEISARDFSKVLKNNPEFRAAFHKAYNPRFVGFSDKVFGSISKRFGFDVSNKDASTGEKPTSERINSASRGENALAGEAAEGAEGVLRKLLSTKAGEIVQKIAKGGKGDAFGLVAASTCLVADVPKLIIATVRSYQIIQVVNYSMQFLIAGSALKAGEITSEQATALGLLLTTAVANKTAMDSFGMKYAMFGDTRTSGTSWRRFIPGASASSSMGSAAQILSGSVKNQICDFATNPATGAAINVALAAAGPGSLGTSLIVAGVNIAAGFLVAGVVEQVGIPLIEQYVSSIDVQPLLQFFLGDLTQNLAGEDVGNAIVSGASNMMGQTANAGGNMPLSVDQAVAYNQTTREVNLAYAEEDRATHSPLDPTNPNTMVGSIVGKIIPYLAGINSLSSALSSVGSIPAGALATFINSSTASALDPTEQYKLCDDPAVKDDNIAAGPFCNISYGIPPSYLNIDPQDVIQSLVDSGDVDPDTGKPVEKDDQASLSQWISTCTDGETDQLKNCQIVDDKTARYSLYIIDSRIQQSMDEEDTQTTTPVDDADTTTVPETTTTPETTTPTEPEVPTESTPVSFNSSVLLNNSLAAQELVATIVSQFIPTSIARSVTTGLSVSTPQTTQLNGQLSRGWYWGVA